MPADKRMLYSITGMISMLVSLLFLYLSLTSASGSAIYFLNPESLGIFGNVIVYLMSGSIFLILFLTLSLMVKYGKFPDIKLPKAEKYGILLIAAIILTGISLAYGLVDGDWIFTPFELIVMGLGISALSILIIHHERETVGLNRLFLSISLGIAILWGVTVATPNTFSTPYSEIGPLYYNVHHSSAYIDSIYNVMQGQPFRGDITDQYGHYALFFYVPLKIFGASTLTISIISGILFAVSFLCLMGAVHVLVKSDYIKILMAVAGGLAVAIQASLNIYWQTHPHRLIFPSIMILFIALASKRKLTKRDYVIGSLISVLSLLWNFESGIASVAAWLFFIIVNYYQHNDLSIKNFIKIIFKVSTAVIVYMLIPFLAVNLYNMSLTGFDTAHILSFRVFLGPISDESYIDALQTKLSWGNLPYLYIIVIFLGCIAWALRDTSIISEAKGPSGTSAVAASVSIAGLALLTMWINRTVSVPSGIFIFIAISLGLIVYGTKGEIKRLKEWKTFEIYELLKISVCPLVLMGLVFMGATAANIGETFDDRYSSGCYDYAWFVHFTEEIEVNVPKDTLAIGQGTTAIYMELGWDKGYYTFGEEDERLNFILSSSDSFFIESRLFEYVDLTVYNIENEFYCKSGTYRYYVRV